MELKNKNKKFGWILVGLVAPLVTR